MILYLFCDRCHAPATKIMPLDDLRLDASLCGACYARTVTPNLGTADARPVID
jgi:hypothetical protein